MPTPDDPIEQPEDWTPAPDPGPLDESEDLDDLIDPETGEIK